MMKHLKISFKWPLLICRTKYNSMSVIRKKSSPVAFAGSEHIGRRLNLTVTRVLKSERPDQFIKLYIGACSILFTRSDSITIVYVRYLEILSEWTATKATSRHCRMRQVPLTEVNSHDTVWRNWIAYLTSIVRPRISEGCRIKTCHGHDEYANKFSPNLFAFQL